jgi:(1->4)-alpha-D-glucan 1-alpha-D-glucosylmutase
VNPSWRATYRLQIHAGFPLAAAAQRLPYLAQLGISHVYLSPCLQATPATTHGYDVTNPAHISNELGGEEAWRNFCQSARDLGLGVLLDFVPNHMAAHSTNAWWDDVLRHGPYSAYAGFFDFVFTNPVLPWRMGLAVLPDSYQTVLGEKRFRVDDFDDGPRLALGNDSWPLNPGSWLALLSSGPADDPAATRLVELGAIQHPDDGERRV